MPLPSRRTKTGRSAPNVYCLGGRAYGAWGSFTPLPPTGYFWPKENRGWAPGGSTWVFVERATLPKPAALAAGAARQALFA